MRVEIIQVVPSADKPASVRVIDTLRTNNSLPDERRERIAFYWQTGLSWRWVADGTEVNFEVNDLIRAAFAMKSVEGVEF